MLCIESGLSMSASCASHQEHLCMSALDTTHKEGALLWTKAMTKTLRCVAHATPAHKAFVYRGVQDLPTPPHHQRSKELPTAM